ncbi:MAG: hypothetical protein ACFE9R_08030 [Candidatus Hermodarchaeota archaeon]
MYQIEKLNETSFYIKATGTFPPPVAERFIKDFGELTKDVHDKMSVIVDITDAILLNIDSIEIILNLLRKNNERLFRSAFIISKNPPLDEEFQYLINRAKSPKRKVVSSLEEAKEWVGIEKIIFKKD